ncbi:MAG: hypothetical protein COV67_00120 [Nitrospinae bacterium CG11_big_fil_rev_8_21_14_0_20_56_8]|nr:MAG: hypothetical protein COV67_00120 [Nitrospinae bacterium CG11_big_fil_rev_8_21_14_0_20_56_8]
MNPRISGNKFPFILLLLAGVWALGPGIQDSQWTGSDLAFAQGTDDKKSDAPAAEGENAAPESESKTAGLERALKQRRGMPEEKEKKEVKLPQSEASANPETFRMIEMLEKKNLDLKKKEEELRVREERVKSLEEKVTRELDMINQAVAKSRQELGLRDETIQKNVDSLIKVYSSMKPEEAAAILEAVDEELALQIISGMKSQVAGQVLSRINVKVAKSISEKLAGKTETKKKN